MKLIITTTYENINQEFLDFYLKRMENAEVLPGSMKIVKELKKKGFASFVSKSPESLAIGTTTYEIVKTEH